MWKTEIPGLIEGEQLSYSSRVWSKDQTYRTYDNYIENYIQRKICFHLFLIDSMTQMLMEWPTTFYLDLKPASRDGAHTRHYYQGQEPVAKQVRGYRREITSVILLDEHSAKLIPSVSLLYHRLVCFSIPTVMVLTADSD